MATVVWIPALIRPLCGGAARLEVDGATLGEILRAVDLRCPGLYDRIVEGGRIRPELAIALDGEVASLALHDVVGTNAEIAIVPAIGGG
jgi:molybdopterin converting factor small subunit